MAVAHSSEDAFTDGNCVFYFNFCPFDPLFLFLVIQFVEERIRILGLIYSRLPVVDGVRPFERRCFHRRQMFSRSGRSGGKPNGEVCSILALRKKQKGGTDVLASLMGCVYFQD